MEANALRRFKALEPNYTICNAVHNLVGSDDREMWI